MPEIPDPHSADDAAPMRVAVLGGSGFIGSSLLLILLQMGVRLNLLYNRTDPDLVSPRGQISTIRGAIENPEALRECFRGCQAVYHLVGLIAETREKTFRETVAEGTAKVAAAAREAGVKRIIYLSALGTAEDAPSRYFRSKWEAEQHVISSGLEYTIFRPSIVYGPRDRFINMIAGMMRRSPVVPVLGDGKYRLQPVYVEELSAVMAAALMKESAAGAIYEVGGPEQLTYLEILDIIKRTIHRRRVNVHIPISAAQWGARLLERVCKPAPLTVDQITMLKAGSTCDHTVTEKAFGVRFSPLEQKLQTYLGK